MRYVMAAIEGEPRDRLIASQGPSPGPNVVAKLIILKPLSIQLGEHTDYRETRMRTEGNEQTEIFDVREKNKNFPGKRTSTME